MILAEITTHTSGINWESVGTIVAAVVAFITLALSIIGRLVTNKITGSIDKFRIDVISRMDVRISLLEQAVFGRRNDDHDTLHV
jgi:hypothetical protein